MRSFCQQPTLGDIMTSQMSYISWNKEILSFAFYHVDYLCDIRQQLPDTFRNF